MKEKFVTIGEERRTRKNKPGVLSRFSKWFSSKKYMENMFAEKLNALRKTTAILVSIAMIGQFTVGVLSIGAKAGDPAHFDGSLAVANVTKGGSYNENSVPALVDEVVQFELAIHNTEPPESGTDAYSVNAKIALPQSAGTALTVTGSAQGSNTNLLSDIASVQTQVPANLQYIPGTAKWKHNTGTSESQKWVTEKVSDNIVTTGVSLGTIHPCWNMQQTVTIQARVMGSSLKVVKSVAIPGTPWVNEDTAKAGDTLSYLIEFENMGNTTLTNMIVGDNLPPYMTYIPGSSTLTNTQFPNGTPLTDGVTTGGIRVGNYEPGSNGYVKLKVKINQDITCGNHRLQNVGIAKADQTLEVWDSAYTNVNCECAKTPKFIISKSAFNITQNVDATKTTAHAGDTIRYSLITSNTGDGEGSYTIADNIADVLEYTNITNANGSTISNGSINFGLQEIGAGETVTKTFDVQVKPLAQWPAGGDVTLTNTYGNLIVVHLGYFVINPAKSAFNDTQNVDATQTFARAGDTITYTLLTRNTGNEAVKDQIVSDDISDVLEYADVVDAKGGVVDKGVISWKAQTIPAGGQLTNTFVVKVKGEIPTNDQDGKSFDLKMENIYGNLVKIDIELPVKPSPIPQILGASASRLAAAGAGNILIIGLMMMMFSSSLFLYVREKYLLEKAMRMAA